MKECIRWMAATGTVLLGLSPTSCARADDEACVIVPLKHVARDFVTRRMWHDISTWLHHGIMPDWEKWRSYSQIYVHVGDEMVWVCASCAKRGQGVSAIELLRK